MKAMTDGSLYDTCISFAIIRAGKGKKTGLEENGYVVIERGMEGCFRYGISTTPFPIP